MHDHGDVGWFFVNLRRSRLPIHRRAILMFENLARRIWTPPHDCCGRYGEPGC